MTEREVTLFCLLWHDRYNQQVRIHLQKLFGQRWRDEWARRKERTSET